MYNPKLLYKSGRLCSVDDVIDYDLGENWIVFEHSDGSRSILTLYDVVHVDLGVAKNVQK